MEQRIIKKLETGSQTKTSHGLEQTVQENSRWITELKSQMKRRIQENLNSMIGGDENSDSIELRVKQLYDDLGALQSNYQLNRGF